MLMVRKDQRANIEKKKMNGEGMEAVVISSDEVKEEDVAHRIHEISDILQENRCFWMEVK